MKSETIIWLQYWRIGDKKSRLAIFFGSNIFGARATPEMRVFALARRPGQVKLDSTSENYERICLNKWVFFLNLGK